VYKESTSNLKALKEMIKLAWREVPRQLRQQFMYILHDRLMFPSLYDTTNDINQHLISFIVSANSLALSKDALVQH